MNEELQQSVLIELLENNTSPLVGIYMMANETPFICAFFGNTCGVMDWLEKDFNDNPDCYAPDKGDGTYYYKASYLKAVYGDWGRIELPDGWELEFVAFVALDCKGE